MLATVAGGCSFGLAKSFGVGRLAGVGGGLFIGLALGVRLGLGIGLGVMALATSARIKLANSMVSNFIIFMEGPFFGVEEKQISLVWTKTDRSE